MENNVYKAMRPLTFVCAVWGFSAVTFEPTKLQILLNLYSWILTAASVLLATVCFVGTTNSLHLSCPSAIDFLSNVIRIAALVKYRIKFISCHDIQKDILDHLNYADKYLESLGLNVQHIKNRVACLILILIRMSIVVAFMYLNIYGVLIDGSFGTQNDVGSIHTMHCDVLCLCLHLHGIVFWFSSEVLYIHFVYITYIILQRLSLVRCALVKLDDVNDRNIAWNDNVLISTISGLRRENMFNQVENYYNKVRTVSTFVLESFHKTKGFYSSYVGFYVFLMTAMYTLVFIVDVIVRGNVVYMSVSLLSFVTALLPVYVCARISTEVRNIHSLVHGLYYKHNMKHLQMDIRRWMVDLRLEDCLLYTSRCV